MSPDIKDFYGQDVPTAIKEACETLGVAQENLSIEVIETGSKGIFGLIRRKAHIKVSRQTAADEPVRTEEKTEASPTDGKRTEESAAPRSRAKRPPRTKPARVEAPVEQRVEAETAAELMDDDDDNGREPVDLSPETLGLIKDELSRLLTLMGCPSTVSVEANDGTAQCNVDATHETILTSQDGRTLDSLQYLLRKIVSRRIPGRIQLSIDVGNYRARRYDELREQALSYASQVKDSGKTQVIPSLNPSERRVVHVCLQDDPDIRSRSVGDGLFKKVLIYKPGKTKKTGRKRSHGGNRKKNGPKQTS